MILLNFFYSLFYQILLLLHGDVETNPGPNKKYKPFTCCHWNVNSLTTRNMVILPSIAAYNTIHKYDFICISETYLDSSVRTDDRDILINGYNIIHADHPSNNKKGGVCIYYQESLAVQLVKTNYLSKCLLCKVSINNKKGYVMLWFFSVIHEQVAIFNDILMNIFSNYIPNKYVTIDNRDPPWMTEKIKNKINLKRSLSKSNKFIEIQMLSTEISTLILERKEKYYPGLGMMCKR